MVARSLLRTKGKVDFDLGNRLDGLSVQQYRAIAPLPDCFHRRLDKHCLAT